MVNEEEIKVLLDGKEVTVKLSKKSQKELDDLKKSLNLSSVADIIRCDTDLITYFTYELRNCDDVKHLKLMLGALKSRAEKQAKQEIAKEIFDDLNLELKKQFERDKKEFNEKGYNTTELEAHNFVMNNLVKKLKAKFLSVGSYTNKTNKKVQLKQEV